MPEWLSGALGTPAVDPVIVATRLLASLVGGAAVAGIHRWSRRASGNSAGFATTLVLLAVLIAMVTQVIGDNVARAFSLVGALSIVRFRTVVRDTQDTAYVIFAVAVGMAFGAGAPWVAGLGIAVVGVAAALLRQPVEATVPDHRFILTIRVALGVDIEQTVSAVLDGRSAPRRLLAIETARQGTAMAATYDVALPAARPPDTLVAELFTQEGVQAVEIRRPGALDTDLPLT